MCGSSRTRPRRSRGNDGIAAVVERPQACLQLRILRGSLGPVRAKHPWECAVNDVAAAGPGGMDTDGNIGSGRPERNAVAIDGMGFCLEKSNFRQRKIQPPQTVAIWPHRHVTPRSPREWQALKMGAHDLITNALRPAEVRAQPGAKPRRNSAEEESQHVAGVTDQARAGLGSHDQGIHERRRRELSGTPSLPQEAFAGMSQRRAMVGTQAAHGSDQRRPNFSLAPGSRLSISSAPRARLAQW